MDGTFWALDSRGGDVACFRLSGQPPNENESTPGFIDCCAFYTQRSLAHGAALKNAGE